MRDTDQLRVICEAFGLDSGDVDSMFGVDVAQLDEQVSEPPPAGFAQKLATVSKIAELLATRLRPERIPQAVRRPAQAFGGISMLEAIAAGQHEAVLEETRASFDWATQP